VQPKCIFILRFVTAGSKLHPEVSGYKFSAVIDSSPHWNSTDLYQPLRKFIENTRVVITLVSRLRTPLCDYKPFCVLFPFVSPAWKSATTQRHLGVWTTEWEIMPKEAAKNKQRGTQWRRRWEPEKLSRWHRASGSPGPSVMKGRRGSSPDVTLCTRTWWNVRINKWSHSCFLKLRRSVTSLRCIFQMPTWLLLFLLSHFNYFPPCSVYAKGSTFWKINLFVSLPKLKINTTLLSAH